MKFLKKNPDKALLVVAVVILSLAAVMSFVALGLAHPVPWLIVTALLILPLVPLSERCASFVHWKDEYAVGITAIDDEHKKLLNLINNLLAAVHCNTGEEFERHAIKELVEYTRYHFQREEELMAAHNFPDFEGHKAQHDQMIDTVERFCKRYEERGRDVLEEVTEHLKLWLLQHILGTDQKYGPYLKSRGVV